MKKCVLALIIAGIMAVSCNNRNESECTLLYWNIQYAMWADQGNNYDNFVEYVKEVNPDICVWCEAKTHYPTGGNKSFKLDDDLYLPAHWGDVAARYGHSYTYVGGDRDFHPQVITSRYPIENMARLVGDDSVVVTHGSGWARVDVNGRKVNIVTSHTWPQKYGFGVDSKDADAVAASIAADEGHRCRAKEVQWVCEHTILTDADEADHLWMMLGDMNSRSRLDADHYKYPEDSPLYWAQDYMATTPYIDAMHRFHNGEYTKSHANGDRIDYIYLNKALYDRLTDIRTVFDGYPANKKVAWGEDKTIWVPSDHYPIVAKFRL